MAAPEIPLKSDQYLDAIRAGHTRFIARFATRDNEDGDAPEWSEPREVVVRAWIRDKPLRSSGRVLPKGQIVTLALTNRLDWAEYSEGDYCGDGLFMAEEYRMQLLQIV